MPIYEYQCTLCGHELEKLQKISDAPLTDCPDCGKPGLQKKISAAGFRLKGGGWYETDFKSNNQKNVVKPEGSKGSGDKSANSGKDAKGGNSESAGSTAKSTSEPKKKTS